MAGGPALSSGPIKRYNGRNTIYLYMCVLMGGMGGLLLGYDNGVIGGVVDYADFQLKFFPSVYVAEDVLDEGATSPYCKYNSKVLQLVVSCLYLAAGAAAIIASPFARKFGRKPLIIIAGITFIVGAGLMAGAVEIGMLVVGRLILGVGVGIGSLTLPIFLAEIAPPQWRGGCNILFQFFVTVGILLAGLINFGFSYVHKFGWRMPFAIAAVPGFIVLIGGLVLPETPVSLIERGHLEKARSVLSRVRGVEDVDEEFQDIIEAARLGNMVQRPWANIFKSQYRPQLYISILFMMFQQFTGINAIIFYAPVLFNSLGSGVAASLENTCIIGGVNVLATIVAIILVDRIGRKALLIEGGVQMVIAEVVAGVVLATQFSKYSVNLPQSVDVGVLVIICVFISGFAWSWGPIGWLYPTEIQPLETRPPAAALNTASNMLFTFVIGQSFVTMLCSMEWGVFIFFAGMVAIMTAWVIIFLPETRGKDLENVFKLFQEHWFWRSRTKVLEVHSMTLPTQKGSDDDMPVNTKAVS